MVNYIFVLAVYVEEREGGGWMCGNDEWWWVTNSLEVFLLSRLGDEGVENPFTVFNVVASGDIVLEV